MGKIIEVNERFIKDQLGEMVRGTVEEALNTMLDKDEKLEDFKTGEVPKSFLSRTQKPCLTFAPLSILTS